MGLTTAGLIGARLMAAGRDGATPALIVVNASRADEQRHPTTLAQLAATAEGLSGPALLIVGEAMALAGSQTDPASFATPTSSAPQDDEGEGRHRVRHGEERALGRASRTTQGLAQ
jgi:uroporphyrin-III C-methyltransferase